MRKIKLRLFGLFLLILLGLTALAQFIGDVSFLFTQLVLSAIVLALILLTYRLIDTSNRRLSTFLLALRHHDDSIRFLEEGDPTFKELYQAFNDSLVHLKKEENKEQQQNAWLFTILEHLPLGCLLVSNNKEVLFINKTAMSLLAIPGISDWQDLENYHSGWCAKLESLPLDKAYKITGSTLGNIWVQKVVVKGDRELELYFFQQQTILEGESEMQAWIRLIRVLTHEIMNSVTAIHSLASTIKEDLALSDTVSDLYLALDSIEKRSRGLIDFSKSYRELSEIRAPRKEWVLLSELIREQLSLLQNDLNGVQLTLYNDGERGQAIQVDKEQINHVLINLLLNAKFALEDTVNPSIEINCYTEKDLLICSIKDNGKGIPAGDQNQVFIPFFSSRKEGKGIGLSLARQLMLNNNASVSLRSSFPGETIFELRFKLSA
jgi:signal transduction histidine kinase